MDATGFTALSLRVGLAQGDTANAAGVDFEILLRDALGQSAAVSSADYGHALFDPPGEPFHARGAEKTTLNAIRVPLSAFAGISLSQLMAVELHFGDSAAGDIQLTELMLQGSMLP